MVAHEGSRIGKILGSEDVYKKYNYTGRGITIGIVDTGTDFSNPDIRDSLARDKNNIPIMIDIFKKYKIKNAYLFGSVLTDKFNNKSDLDILINFQNEVTDPLLKGELLWSLQFAIEDAFHRYVDLLQETTPKNPYFIKELQETRQLIYEQ